MSIINKLKVLKNILFSSVKSPEHAIRLEEFYKNQAQKSGVLEKNSKKFLQKVTDELEANKTRLSKVEKYCLDLRTSIDCAGDWRRWKARIDPPTPSTYSRFADRDDTEAWPKRFLARSGYKIAGPLHLAESRIGGCSTCRWCVRDCPGKRELYDAAA